MSHFSFDQNTNIQFKGRRYRIGNNLPEGEIELHPIDSGSYMILKRSDLQNSYSKGELIFLDKAWAKLPVEEMPISKLPEDLSQLPKNIINETIKKKKYVIARLERKDLSMDEKNTLKIIKDVSEEINDKKPPRSSAVLRWCKSYQKSGGQILSLVPRYKDRGPKNRYISTEVSNIIDYCINKYYLTRERKSVVATHDFVKNEINTFNKIRAVNTQLKTPCSNTTRNIINELDPYQVVLARYGKETAERKFRQSGKGPTTTRPLERVEIDHTKADLFVIDDVNRLPLGRPWITIAIDHNSRAIAGIHIGFTPPSYLTVMKCLKHAILPKTDLHSKYPEIENDWNVHGIPEQFVCDNGKEFLSESLEMTCHQLGIDLSYCPVMKPWFKGVVERAQGTMNRDLLQVQPGTTFANIFEKDDYDPSKHAVVTLHKLRTLIYKWICDVYHVSHHRGLNGVPIKNYERGIKEFPPTLPRQIKDIDVLMGRKDERTIQHTGIQFNHLYYNSAELSPIRHRLNGNKVTIRVDEENLGHLYVYDELERRYIDVSCTYPEYAEGLTLWQHSVICRYVRLQNEADSDIDAVIRAKADIQEMVDEASTQRKRKTGTSMKIARWQENNNESAQINEQSNTNHQSLKQDENFSFESLNLPDFIPASDNQPHSSGWGIES